MRAGVKRPKVTPVVFEPDPQMEEPQIACGRGDGSPVAASQSFGSEADGSSIAPALSARV